MRSKGRHPVVLTRYWKNNEIDTLLVIRSIARQMRRLYLDLTKTAALTSVPIHCPLIIVPVYLLFSQLPTMYLNKL